MKIESYLHTYIKYSKIANQCAGIVKKHIPNEDIKKIEKIILLDRNESSDYVYAGGMYFLKREDNPAYIELYIEQILQEIPKFVPKVGVFLKYAIAKIILHEIAHHVNRKYAYERNSSEWEKSSSGYTIKHLWLMFGKWMYVFLTIGSINELIYKLRGRNT